MKTPPNKKSHARPGDWKNVLLSPGTQALVERFQGLLATEDAVGDTPSKHKAIATALAESIRRRRGKRS